jgi:RNA polymerase sigma-70 factor (ECF subfamily)
LDQKTSNDDTELIALLRRDPEKAMPRIFESYYQEVCYHVYRIIPVRETCEDIAQSIFLELWKKRHDLDIRTSIGAYLHKMSLSRALNYIRDNKKHQHETEEKLTDTEIQYDSPLQQLTDQELQGVIEVAIDALPPRCREVFVLSRFEGLSYLEISRALDISPKTVENQISKALMLLRSALQTYDRGKQL